MDELMNRLMDRLIEELIYFNGWMDTKSEGWMNKLMK